MHDFPHQYGVSAVTRPGAPVVLASEGLDNIDSVAPVEFGGPGGRWSPETLLVAAVADCFALSFQAIARASRFEWHSLACEVLGTLDRTSSGTRFTEILVQPTLVVSRDADSAKARRLLEKAEHSCLITNSLIADTRLDITVQTTP